MSALWSCLFNTSHQEFKLRHNLLVFITISTFWDLVHLDLISPKCISKLSKFHYLENYTCESSMFWWCRKEITWFWWCQRRIKQGHFKRISTASRYKNVSTNKKALIQDFFKIKPCLKTKGFKVMQDYGNRLPEGKFEK